MVKPDPLADERLSWVGLLIEASVGVRRHLDRVHARHGLAGSDFGSLLRLARSPDEQLRMSDLAAQTGMSTSGMTRVIDRLEDQDLVRRATGDADGRSLVVSLTRTGRRLLEADAAALVDAIEGHLVEPVGDDRMPEFVAALTRLRDATNPAAAGRPRRRPAAANCDPDT